MARGFGHAFLSFAAAAMVLANCLGLNAQTVPVRSRCYEETGVRVEGPFLDYFDANGGLRVFGLPRTEQFAQDGLTVQYFQRARMELHPEHEPGARVVLSPLCELMGYGQAPIPASSIIPSASPYRRYYAVTGHSVSYAFLEFFDAHGGVAVLGYPISEMVNEEGTIVQYFQRAKVLWHPENGIADQVELGNIGDEYLARTGVAGAYLRPITCTVLPATALTPDPTVPPSTPVPLQPTVAQSGAMATPTPRRPTPIPSQPTAEHRMPMPTERVVPPWKPVPTLSRPRATPAPPVTRPAPLPMTANAWVKYANTGQGGSQTAYVRVLDQRGRPVRGAAVQVLVHFSSGVRSLRAPSTDGSGYSSVSFPIGFSHVGNAVVVEVQVSLGAQTATAYTRFFPLW